MNLFWMRAAFLADCHVVKMPLEYAQLLSNAYYAHGQTPPSGYRQTHAKHPCSLWTARSTRHWHAVAQLAFEALAEYTYRFGRVHKCWFKITAMVRAPPQFGAAPSFKEDTVCGEMGDFDDVPLCMPAEFHDARAPIAYVKYYLHKLRTIPRCARWHRRENKTLHYVAVVGCLCALQQQAQALKRSRSILYL